MLRKLIFGAMIILLLSLLCARVESEEWVPHVPGEDNVYLDYWRENDTSYVTVSIVFASSGYNVSDWGTPTSNGNNMSVNAIIWQWTGWVYLWVVTVTHTYNLGNLSVGRYLFTFRVWCVPVKNITFNVYANATLDIYPQALNLRSRGHVTACLELSQDYNVSDIDVSTILLNNTVPIDATAPFSIGDRDGDNIPDLTVEFNSTEVQSYICSNINMKELYQEKFLTVTISITGYLNDNTPFQGSDAITILTWIRSGINRYIVST